MSYHARASVCVTAAAMIVSSQAAIVEGHATERVSVSSSGAQGNAWSSAPAVSADGRTIVFSSGASNLVTGDTNGSRDVFVHELDTGITARVSISSTGNEGNGDSGGVVRQVSVSADGRYVAFSSDATNLVDDDGNNESDVFLHDRVTGITIRVSVDSAGVQGNERSYLASLSALSADGRYVAFYSRATTLVADDTNDAADIFVRDVIGGVTVRVSVDSDGQQFGYGSNRPSISSDGRYVAFDKLVTIVAGVFVHDRDTDEDGVFDEVGGIVTELVAGAAGFPAISADGRYIAYHTLSDVGDPSQVLVHDRDTALDTWVSRSPQGEPGDGSSTSPSISADGRKVAFATRATNLIPGDANGKSDIMIRDLDAGATTLVSISSRNAQGNGDSWTPSISGDGRFVAFGSLADNMVVADTNGVEDVFVRDREGAGLGIPAVSHWGLIAMALLLLLSASVAIKRRVSTSVGGAQRSARTDQE